MVSLFVSYTAVAERGGRISGWVTLRNRGEPQSTSEIAGICRTIAENEKVAHVIPVWWRTVDRD